MAKKKRQRIERVYSDEEKADALLAVEMAGGEGHIKATAERIEIPERTLNDWWNDRHGITPAVARIREYKRQGLSDALYSVASLGVAEMQRLIEGKQSTLRDVTGAVKVASETAQLLSGEATAITEQRGGGSPLIQFNSQTINEK